jgi:hypothetical protein
VDGNGADIVVAEVELADFIGRGEMRYLSEFELFGSVGLVFAVEVAHLLLSI